MSEKTHVGNLKLIGGELCLDFANTVDWRLGGQPHEWLETYADLIAWSRHAGILTQSEARWLLRMAGRSPGRARAVLRRAVQLRELIYRLFSAIAHGITPAARDVEKFNRALSNSLYRMRLVQVAGSFEWDWDGGGQDLERPLGHILRSAAALLTGGGLKRIRQCRDGRCGWLFYDHSKNRSRCWCAMEDCGNRAKARRFYSRHRAEAAAKE